MKYNFDDEIMSEIIELEDKLFLSPEAVNKLAELKRLKEEIEAFEKSIKERIVEKALKIDPNFSSISSDKAKLTYSFHGSKYWVEPDKIEYIPEGLVEKTVKFSPNAKTIELYVSNYGKLPDGIKQNDRKKSLSIIIKGEGVDDEEV